MKQFNGYAEAKKRAQYVPGEKLPAGAYVCKVMGVRYDTFDWGDVINIQFDIVEGEFADFFKKQYEANTAEDKKWKGVARVNVPKDDGSDKDEWTKNSFATWTNGFEDSNPGYSWDWDENKWKGKLIGIRFGETGTVINGKNIVFTEARGGCSVENVRAGKVKPGKFISKKGYTAESTSATQNNDAGFMDLPAGSDEEIPF